MSKDQLVAQARKASPYALAMAIGWLIGAGAWGEGRTPALAVVLPVAVALAGNRLQAFIVALAYMLGAERGGPFYISTWFDNNLLIGVGLWIASALAGAAAWMLAWTAADKPWRKALATVIASLVALLPPVGIVTMGHPLVAWGYIVSGTGWIGVALSLLVPAGVVWMMANKSWRPVYAVGGLALFSVPFGSLGFNSEPMNTRDIGGMVAVSTKWGKAEDIYDILDRVQRMGRTVKALADDNLASVVVFPESVLQTYDPALFPILQAEILAQAQKAGQTVVLSMDLRDKDGNFETVATAMYPDGRAQTATARQTVPFALWKPWASEGSFKTDWTAGNILPLREGVTARVLFCYEEYIPLLSLINEAKDDHNLVMVLSNTWAAKDEGTAAIQARHSEGMARLFGKQMLRAENRPKPPKPAPIPSSQVFDIGKDLSSSAGSNR